MTDLIKVVICLENYYLRSSAYLKHIIKVRISDIGCLFGMKGIEKVYNNNLYCYKL